MSRFFLLQGIFGQACLKTTMYILVSFLVCIHSSRLLDGYVHTRLFLCSGYKKRKTFHLSPQITLWLEYSWPLASYEVILWEIHEAMREGESQRALYGPVMWLLVWRRGSLFSRPGPCPHLGQKLFPLHCLHSYFPMAMLEAQLKMEPWRRVGKRGLTFAVVV